MLGYLNSRLRHTDKNCKNCTIFLIRMKKIGKITNLQIYKITYLIIIFSKDFLTSTPKDSFWGKILETGTQF